MKLRNKKTGEIGNLITICATTRVFVDKKSDKVYNTLAELTNEWEDCEEPKEYWYIDWNGEVCRSDIYDERTEQMKQIGNYFETKEEAEKAVEKLKAWKRLKDKGFRFHDWKKTTTYCLPYDWNEDVMLHEIDKDLDLLFGGEE